MKRKLEALRKESLYLCTMNKKRIAVFASGKGSNALNLIRHFKTDPKAEVAFVLSNRSDAGVLTLAEENGVRTVILSNEEVANADLLIDLCKTNEIDLIVLAGYLRKIPEGLILHYPERIVNIHPALLPKFGGKNMYGDKVHEAVLASGEKESGITIHFVNEEFDKGRVIDQFTCTVEKNDTLETLRSKIQGLEHAHFAPVISKIIEHL
jgi:phosphoribosylglycinamide formyltransferase 1